MCYETAQLAYKIYKEAQRLNASPEELEHLRQKWKKLAGDDSPNFYHVSGYDHPELVAFSSSIDMDRYEWGLIPHWLKDPSTVSEFQNKTLNARGETLFEKASFRDAAHENRVILPLEGFFEHYHKNKMTFPYFIRRVDGQRLLVGGIASEWRNPVSGEVKKTVSIVTTRGNELMAGIHNNPKLKEPRMPLVLEDAETDQWLHGNQQEIEALIRPNSSVALTAHTVKRLKGRSAVGNTPEAQEEFLYDELNDPLTLF